MSSTINYKMKYQGLKAKFYKSVEMAYRLGFEDGNKQASLDNANQQLAQAAAEPQPGQEPAPTNNNGAAGTPDQGGAPDKAGAPSVQPAPVEGEAPAPMADSEHPEGSELDRHIAELEGMLSKSELVNPADLILAVSKIQSLRKSMHQQAELKKSAMAIPAIAKALHKPQFKFGVQAQHNLSSSAKSAVTMQHKIVENVMKKWEQEEQKAGKDILSVLNIENITKDDE